MPSPARANTYGWPHWHVGHTNAVSDCAISGDSLLPFLRTLSAPSLRETTSVVMLSSQYPLYVPTYLARICAGTLTAGAALSEILLPTQCLVPPFSASLHTYSSISSSAAYCSATATCSGDTNVPGSSYVMSMFKCPKSGRL